MNISELLKKAEELGSLKDAYVKLSAAQGTSPGAQAMALAASQDKIPGAPPMPNMNIQQEAEQAPVQEDELLKTKEELISAKGELERERVAHRETEAKSQISDAERKALSEVEKARAALESEKSQWKSQQDSQTGILEAEKLKSEAEALRAETETRKKLDSDILKSKTQLMDDTLKEREKLADRMLKDKDKLHGEVRKAEDKIRTTASGDLSGRFSGIASTLSGLRKKAEVVIPMPGRAPVKVAAYRPDIMRNNQILEDNKRKSQQARQTRQELEGREEKTDYSSPELQASHQEQIRANAGKADALGSQMDNTAWEADPNDPSKVMRKGEWGVQRKANPSYQPAQAAKPTPSPVSEANPSGQSLLSRPTTAPQESAPQAQENTPQPAAPAALQPKTFTEGNTAPAPVAGAQPAQNTPQQPAQPADGTEKYKKEYYDKVAPLLREKDRLTALADEARTSARADGGATLKRYEDALANVDASLKSTGDESSYVSGAQSADEANQKFLQDNKQYEGSTLKLNTPTEYSDRTNTLNQQKMDLERQLASVKYNPYQEKEIQNQLSTVSNELNYMNNEQVQNQWLSNKGKSYLDLSGASPEMMEQNGNNMLAMKQYKVQEAEAAAAHGTDMQKRLAAEMRRNLEQEESAMKTNDRAGWNAATADAVINGRNYEAMQKDKFMGQGGLADLYTDDKYKNLSDRERLEYMRSMDYFDDWKDDRGLLDNVGRMVGNVVQAPSKVLANVVGAGYDAAGLLGNAAGDIGSFKGRDDDANTYNRYTRKWNRDSDAINALGGQRSKWLGSIESRNPKTQANSDIRHAIIDSGGNRNGLTFGLSNGADFASKTLPAGKVLPAAQAAYRTAQAAATAGKAAPLLRGAARGAWDMTTGSPGGKLTRGIYTGANVAGPHSENFYAKKAADSSLRKLASFIKAALTPEQLEAIKKAPKVSQEEVDMRMGGTPQQNPTQTSSPAAVSLQNTNPDYYNKSLPGVMQGGGPQYSSGISKMLFEAGIPLAGSFFGFGNPYGNTKMPTPTNYISRPLYAMPQGSMKATYGE